MSVDTSASLLTPPHLLPEPPWTSARVARIEGSTFLGPHYASITVPPDSFLRRPEQFIVLSPTSAVMDLIMDPSGRIPACTTQEYVQRYPLAQQQSAQAKLQQVLERGGVRLESYNYTPINGVAHGRDLSLTIEGGRSVVLRVGIQPGKDQPYELTVSHPSIAGKQKPLVVKDALLLVRDGAASKDIATRLATHRSSAVAKLPQNTVCISAPEYQGEQATDHLWNPLIRIDPKSGNVLLLFPKFPLISTHSFAIGSSPAGFVVA